MTQPQAAETKTYHWAHHTTWEGEQVKPGDEVDMTADQARSYIDAGMLTVDPEDVVAVNQALGLPADPALEGSFSPEGKNVGEVEAYLSTASEEERQRVIAIEKKSSSPRKGITEFGS